jgi:hypothetical protein
MMKHLSVVLAATTLAAGLVMSPASQAVTQSRIVRVQGGPACQLSVPTTATTVRPRATGIRNEGTTSAFVICQFDSSTGDLTGAQMYLSSLDGVSHNIPCTGVNGFNISPSLMNIGYSSKTVTTDAVAGYGIVAWDATDFGAGVAGDDLPHSGFFSVTCLLPPQTAINLFGFFYNEDVGS